MALSKSERERLNDGRLKLQSVANSLTQVNPKEVPNLEEIQDCLEDAEKSFDGALRVAEEGEPRK